MSITFSEEHKRNLSESHKGQIPWNCGLTNETDEKVNKISEALKGNKHALGYKHSEEAKQKIRIAHLGRKFSAEHRKNISKACHHKGKDNSFYGKKHTKETKQKISIANKGKKRTEGQRKRISEAFKGRKYSKEHNRKISLARKGIPCSEEAKRKISEANKGRVMSEETRRKMSESTSGEKHPCWKGGASLEPYGVEFNRRLKEQIRVRDEFRCQECFRHQNELPEKLSVHHIDFNKKNHNPNNLIALCRNCHAQTNHTQKDWTEYFQTQMLERGF